MFYIITWNKEKCERLHFKKKKNGKGKEEERTKIMSLENKEEQWRIMSTEGNRLS